MAEQIIKTATAPDEDRLSPWWYWRSARIPRRVGRGRSTAYLRISPTSSRHSRQSVCPRERLLVHGYAGAAMWLPPEVSPDDDAGRSAATHRARTSPKDVFAVFEQMARYHPQEPHRFLPFIGVDPLQQGKGCGAALMQHALIPWIVTGRWAISNPATPRISRSMNGMGLSYGHYSGGNVAAHPSNAPQTTLTGRLRPGSISSVLLQPLGHLSVSFESAVYRLVVEPRTRFVNTDCDRPPNVARHSRDRPGSATKPPNGSVQLGPPGIGRSGTFRFS